MNNTTQLKTIKGLLLKDNKLKTDDGIQLVTFDKNFNYDYYLYRYIFVSGYTNGSTLVVKEVILT